MWLRRTAWLVFLCLSLAACGVKLPPIAPEKPPVEPAPPKLDCSPEDPTCDKTDKNYRPRKR